MEKLTYNNYLIIDPFSVNTIVKAVDEAAAERRYVKYLNESKEGFMARNLYYRSHKPVTVKKFEKELTNWSGVYKIISPTKFEGDTFKGDYVIKFEGVECKMSTDNFNYKILNHD